MKFCLLILKNVGRNKLRTALTALAVVALVAVFALIVTVVGFLDMFTTEKSKDVNLMLNERFRLMSAFDIRFVEDIVSPSSPLSQELRQIPGFDAEKHTIWHFVILTLDPERKDNDKMFFALATYPDKIRTMTDNLKPEEFDPAWVGLMRKPPRSQLDNSGIVMGGTVAKRLKFRVGDDVAAISISHHDGTALREPITMKFEVIAILPEDSSWNDASFIDYAYLDRVLKEKKNEFDGKVSYAWLQVADQKAAEQVSQAIERRLPDLRCETSATAYSRFMAPLNDMLWGLKYILVPAILVVMTVVLANTFSITVRERQIEMAVLKVLGFSSRRILLLVLGEAGLVGLLSGLLGAAVTFGLVNLIIGGITLTGMPKMLVPTAIFWWGPVIGIVTALVGGILPAWSARSVKVSGVFANVA